ncbi:MAG: M20/M25/M40 family metallo-hydrolase [Alphaproteobacteria bacterium]|nr:M20/M25/M40 family metallo-hydrolase [Alphaproteobacteria bacterium]
MTGDWERLRDYLRDRGDEQVAFFADLVRRPSENPPGDLAGHAEASAVLLEGLGFEVERHAVPAGLVRDAGLVSVTNLVVRLRFGEGPTVALNAHGDAVPAGEGWTRPPYGAEIDDGVLYGRAAATSKSDFATYAFALLALQAVGPKLAGTVELHFTYDEESGGGLGPEWLLAQGITKPDLAICAGLAHGVVVAHNGCLHLEVRVRGRQAHAALPATGVDALEAATGVLGALYEARKGYGQVRSSVDGIESPSLVVGRFEGGVNTNVVPDLVALRLDRRLIPEENPGAVEADLRERIEAAVAAYPGAAVEVERLLLAEPLIPTEASTRLGQTIAAAATEVSGEAVGLHGVPLYTDARHYARTGVPTVLYGAGPRTIAEANAHGADEQLRLTDLGLATEVVALALSRLLDVG